MVDIGWPIILICIFTPGSLFFALNSLALRSFSRLKLQDAFRDAKRDHLIDSFLDHAEELTLTCGFIRIILNTAIIFLLLLLFEDRHYLLAFTQTAPRKPHSVHNLSRNCRKRANFLPF